MCREALAEIDALVDMTAKDSETFEGEDSIFSLGDGAASGVEGGVEALGPFFSANEGFRGQIRREVLKAANQQVCSLACMPCKGKRSGILGLLAASEVWLGIQFLVKPICEISCGCSLESSVNPPV
jgi:hypothetical protein